MKICFAGFDLPEGKIKYQDGRLSALAQKFSPPKVTPFYVEFIRNDFLNCQLIFISLEIVRCLLPYVGEQHIVDKLNRGGDAFNIQQDPSYRMG